MIRKDILWKAIIEELIDDFILFFFSEYAHLIDFESGFEFLDKELQQIFPESETDRRHADKLIKAKLKDGSIVYFLIHIEVQGYAKSKISALLDFIRYYVNFTNSEFSSKFEEEIDSLTQANKPYPINFSNSKNSSSCATISNFSLCLNGITFPVF